MSRRDFACLVGLVFGACIIPAQGVRAQAAVSDSVTLTDETAIQAARARAVAGSAVDSYRLAQHFLDHETFDFENYVFFLRLSAEQGSCDGIVAQKRLESSDTVDESLRTGIDWMARERQAGCRKPPNFER